MDLVHLETDDFIFGYIITSDEFRVVYYKAVGTWFGLDW